MKILTLLIGAVLAEFEGIIRSCGMFKLYKNRYLSGVKKFETVTVSDFSLQVLSLSGFGTPLYKTHT